MKTTLQLEQFVTEQLLLYRHTQEVSVFSTSLAFTGLKNTIVLNHGLISVASDMFFIDCRLWSFSPRSLEKCSLTLDPVVLMLSWPLLEASLSKFLLAAAFQGCHIMFDLEMITRHLSWLAISNRAGSGCKPPTPGFQDI